MIEPRPSSASPPPRPYCAETHISWVLLGDEHAFKLPKPVVTDVVDQRTVALRREICEREVALNRRIAPDVYLGVGSIQLDGDELEPVIVMARMPEERRLSALLDSDDAPDLLAAVARSVARFHASARVIDEADAASVSSRQALSARWSEDVAGLRALVASERPEQTQSTDVDRDANQRREDRSLVARIDAIGSTAHRYLAGRDSLFEERIGGGMVRDGHGDLLAGDVFCLDDGPRILDCLAFDDHLRWNDVLADVAFLVMDIQRLGHAGLAHRFLAEYGRFSGEHHPGSLAHLYVAQRALVRAKVTAQRSAQDRAERREVGELLALAADHLDRSTVRMTLVGGIPGSGKSTVADRLAAETGWTVLASDEIRRDLGLRAADLEDRQAYDESTVAAVYREMRRRARWLMERGMSVILDATWTTARERAFARRLAEETVTDLVEFRCVAPESLCATRVAARSAEGLSEATPDVVHALASRTDPWPEATVIDTGDQSPTPTPSQLIAAHGPVWPMSPGSPRGKTDVDVVADARGTD